MEPGGRVETIYWGGEEMKEPVDSTVETLRHIKRVSQLLTEAATELLKRAAVHDSSKLEEPEKSGFDVVTQKLAGSTYGSDEYKSFLKELQPILAHHYSNNSHHPEHYANGVFGFNLFDLIEMFFDWKAAGERHSNGNIYKSIEHNTNRFCLDPQIVEIFKNTAKFLNYPEPE